MTGHCEKQAQRKNQVVGQCRHKTENQSVILCDMLFRHILPVHRSLIAGPFAEEFIFNTTRLDRLDHLNPGNRGGLQLRGIAQPDAGDIDLLVGNEL